MTTIIAVETKKSIIVGSDTQSTSYKKSHYPADEGKIVQNGHYVLATAGRARMNQELKYSDLPTPPANPGELDKFMATEFIDTLKELTEKAGCELGQNEYIVVVRGRVFQYNIDFNLAKGDNGVYTIGSGSPWAEGVLAGLDKITVRDVESALKAAAKNDPHSSGPFKIVQLTR